jgi:hypothetical protein
MKKILHTIDVIYEIAKRNRQIQKFYFAAYCYVPQALSDKERLKIYKVDKNPIDSLKKRIYLLKIPEGWALALMLKVKTKTGKIMYIPQIDFGCSISNKNCSVSNKNLDLIKRRFHEVMESYLGYLISSGNSYHYLGLTLLTKIELYQFLGNSLLLQKPWDPCLADWRWVGHALRGDYMDLRIFATKLQREPEEITLIKNN